MASKKKTIKFPRIVVSAERHAALALEAEKKGKHISEIAEAKFVKAK